MSEKKLSDVFSKFTPTTQIRCEIFENAAEVTVKGDRARKMYEVSFSYPYLRYSRRQSVSASLSEAFSRIIK